jgi:hypothetical protein
LEARVNHRDQLLPAIIKTPEFVAIVAEIMPDFEIGGVFFASGKIVPTGPA